jgi:hypothetical protein
MSKKVLSVFVPLVLLCSTARLYTMDAQLNSPTDDKLSVMQAAFASTNTPPELQAPILAALAKYYIYGTNGYPTDHSKALEILAQILRFSNLTESQRHEAELDYAALTSPHGPTRSNGSGILDSEFHNGFACGIIK